MFKRRRADTVRYTSTKDEASSLFEQPRKRLREAQKPQVMPLLLSKVQPALTHPTSYDQLLNTCDGSFKNSSSSATEENCTDENYSETDEKIKRKKKQRVRKTHKHNRQGKQKKIPLLSKEVNIQHQWAKRRVQKLKYYQQKGTLQSSQIVKQNHKEVLLRNFEWYSQRRQIIMNSKQQVQTITFAIGSPEPEHIELNPSESQHLDSIDLRNRIQEALNAIELMIPCNSDENRQQQPMTTDDQESIIDDDSLSYYNFHDYVSPLPDYNSSQEQE